MSPVSPRRKGGLPGLGGQMNGPMLALVAVAGVVVVLGILMALGIVDLSKLRSNKPNYAGLIAVPTPARAIPAYTRVRRDHLWDPVNTRFTVVYLPPRAVTPEMMT